MKPHSLRVCLSWALLCGSAAADVPSQASEAASVAAASSDAKMFKREQNGITYNVFEHAATNSTMSFVKDSGICETTPGVSTYSGYLSVGTNMSMFFWFFEARNSPSSAPLALWLNGGPGCSSMIGIFQENGPCHFPVNGSTAEPTLNQYSWNNYANMLYVDQPIGAGFSYGTDNATSTVTAAPFVWNFMQAFFTAFPTYESREFGLWTESYGGHYGPEFSEYFASQNKAISNNQITGEVIDIVALGINNGWIDPKIQFQAYIDFGHDNSWRQLINDTQYSTLQQAYETQCLPLLEKCPSVTGTDAECYSADNACSQYVEGVVESGPPNYPDFDVYDIREPSKDPYPPETYVSYLQRADVMKAIGAQVTYAECPDAPYYKIANTGDDSRSFLDSLSSVVQSGVNTLIWAGDADWICNYLGVVRAIHHLQHTDATEFAAASLSEYTLNATSYGEFKTAGKLHYLKVHAAGHEVAYYQPEISLQAFTQVMRKKPLQST